MGYSTDSNIYYVIRELGIVSGFLLGIHSCIPKYKKVAVIISSFLIFGYGSIYIYSFGFTILALPYFLIPIAYTYVAIEEKI